jgi:GTPase
MDASVATLQRLAQDCNADVTPLRVHTEASGAVGDFLVRSNLADDDFMDIRVAVVGNVDAGKSTMLGVLTHGGLDDGRGKCRSMIFRHKHEAC